MAGRREAEGGFTVVELMITVALMAVIIGATLGVLESVMRSSSFSQQRGEAIDQVRLAMDSMTKEIRQTAKVHPSTASSLDIDTYRNGQVTRVVYSVSGSLLYRTAGGGSRQIVSKLKSPDIFSYYYAGAQTPQATAPGTSPLTQIAITFPLGLTNPATDIVLSSAIQLRNSG
ncbi:MAG: hypothetical protein WDA71_00850 [Actinomycetota bacterium]